MTANKRRKNKTRAIMETTGTNYVRAARAVGSMIIKDPVRLSWSPGTTTTHSGVDLQVRDNFLSYDSPHLLIPGMGAAEPERMLSDMIDQVAGNNSPEDVQFFIIEPAMALKGYEKSPHTKNYVDSWTTGDFIRNASGLILDAVQEMDRRKALFINHEKSPKNLSKARSIAIAESAASGEPLTQHPLYLPYQIIVIHEISFLTSQEGNSGAQKDHEQLRLALSELMRKSRSAGIHIACSTRSPEVADIPDLYRINMRKIGLATSNELVSQTFMGDDSCLGIPKTKGVIQYTNSDGTGVRTVMFDRTQNALPHHLDSE